MNYFLTTAASDVLSTYPMPCKQYTMSDEATTVRDSWIDDVQSETRFAEWERLWFEEILPRACKNHWDDTGKAFAFCWMSITSNQRLWIRCHKFESVMISMFRAAKEFDKVTVEGFAKAYAAHTFRKNTLGLWKNLPEELWNSSFAELDSRNAQCCADICECCAHAQVLSESNLSITHQTSTTLWGSVLTLAERVAITGRNDSLSTFWSAFIAVVTAEACYAHAHEHANKQNYEKSVALMEECVRLLSRTFGWYEPSDSETFVVAERQLQALFFYVLRT